MDYSEKAEIFNKYFAAQCTPLGESDELPNILPKTNLSLTTLHVSEEKILAIIRGFDPNKSSGWDNLSPRMLKMCHSSIVSPLKIIFETCIREGVFPEKWKMSL